MNDPKLFFLAKETCYCTMYRYLPRLKTFHLNSNFVQWDFYKSRFGFRDMNLRFQILI